MSWPLAAATNSGRDDPVQARPRRTTHQAPATNATARETSGSDRAARSEFRLQTARPRAPPLVLLGCATTSNYPGYSEWREAQFGERPGALWSGSHPVPELPASTTVEVRGPDGREPPGTYGAPGLRVHVVGPDGQERSTAIDTDAIWLRPRRASSMAKVAATARE